MPKMSMGKVVDQPPVPAGVYITRIGCTGGMTKDGSAEMWKLSHVIVSGPEGREDPSYIGRHVIDRITWNQGGMMRCKTVIGKLGYNVDEDVERDWVPSMLVNRTARVQVNIVSDQNGKLRNEIPWNGYLDMIGDGNANPGPSPEASPIANHGELPF